MAFSFGIAVLVIGSFHHCSADLPKETFFNLTFEVCFENCVDKCFQDPPKPTDVAFRNCKCDQDCVIFGDCCISFYTFCHLFRHPIDNINFIKSIKDKEKQTEEEKQISDFNDKAQCVNFILRRNLVISILAITTCPAEYPEGDIKDKCTGGQTASPLDIPVSIPAYKYWLFKNVYCALCNNFTLDDVLYWQAEIQCYIRLEDDIITVEQLADYTPDVPCKTIVTLPDERIKVRVCDPELEPRCTETKQDLPNFSPHENTTASAPQDSNEPISDQNQGENQIANFTGDHNVSLPKQNLEKLNNTVSTPFPFPSIPFDLPNISIDALTQANLDVLCNGYMYEYGVPENGSFVRYFNPHCRACKHGWSNVDHTRAIRCEIYGGGYFDRIPIGSRLVRFQFGILEKHIYFFSMESMSLLESSHPKCSAEKYFEFVTKSCELFPCPVDYYSYYQKCMPTFLTINATTFRHNRLQTTLYAKTNVILKENTQTFQEITNYVIDTIAKSGLNTYRPDNSHHPTTLPLNIRINSMHIMRLPKHINPEKNSVQFVDGLVKVDLEIPVLFDDLNQTITYWRQGTWFEPASTFVSNYPQYERLVCYNGRGETYENLDLNMVQKRAFVEIDGGLIDLMETKFKLHITPLYPFQSLTVEVCRPMPKDTQAQDVPKMKAQCDNLTSHLSQFSLSNGSLRFSDKFIIPHGDFFIKGDKVDICSRALRGNILLVDDGSPRTIFKNVASVASLALKVLAVVISFITRDKNPGTVYFQSLGMTCSLIDIIHFLENLTFQNSEEILAVLLHLAWLLVAYNLCAWCMNMVCCNSKATLKCLSRHFSMSLVVPVFTILMCATGDVNTPPWNIGYGTRDKIFSAQLKVVLYGYIIPFALGITFVLICHIYRLARRKSFKKNKSFYSSHLLVTGVLTLQFGFGCSETLSEVSVYYFLYFSSTVLVAWSFLLIACHGLKKPKSRSSNPSLYLQSTNNNPYSVPIQSKPEE